MCGIAAIFAYGESAPPVDHEELVAIRDRMRNRGPDGEGAWISPDRRVGFGHRRLSIIDLSEAGAEPMWNVERTHCIVFNGEIYNYAQLRSELSVKGHRFHGHCDAEVVLQLYASRGKDMLNDLRGMYAFVIWDATEQRLFAARDPFGVKPLYYADDGHTIRFVSQVKALRASSKVDFSPDPAGHVGFFLWGHVPDPCTLYRGVSNLPAGHWMLIDRQGAQAPREFCNITSILAEAERSAREIQSAKSEIGNGKSSPLSASDAELLRSALAETVKYHLVADVPVGVFLSSGLDSTMIAALAAEQGTDLRTVTLGFDEYRGTANDEVPLAEEFARRCGARHQTIRISRADFETQRNALFESMDRPSIDGVNTFFVSLAAKQAGLKVALSGLGGDELFGSYPSFRGIPALAQAAAPFARFLPGLGRELRIVFSPLLKRYTSPKYASVLEYGGSYAGAYLLRRGLYMPWELSDLLDPDLVKAGWEKLQTLARLNDTLDDIRSPRLRVSALEMSWYMRHQLLRDSDWAGMGHSVEIRVPFVDVDLLRRLAPLFSRPGAPGKRAVAAVASDLISPEMLSRPKTGFSVPVRDWLLSDTPSVPSLRLADRGLRGWAKQVYRRFPGSQLRPDKPQPTIRRRQNGKRIAPASASSRNRISMAASSRAQPKRIVVFRIGQLGDTIVSLPAMWVVRKSFPEAHLALLCDKHVGKSHVLASDLLRGSKIFDEYLTYPVFKGSEMGRRGRMAALLATIRGKHFDTLVYLAPNNRTPEQIARDHRFFVMAGIRNFIGMEGFEELPVKEPGKPLPMMAAESVLLLRRLAAAGLKILPGDEKRMDVGLQPNDEEILRKWLAGLPSDDGRRWIAVGPGSKMPAKRWPLVRFHSVVHDLIAKFDVWPVVFGGAEDEVFGEWLIERWKRGYNAAGALGIRPSIGAMKRCRMFLGNDTGTMHMAAAAGVRCVAIFSSREHPGLWYPAGHGHRIFRTEIECEGCRLMECLERGNACLEAISADEVYLACSEILTQEVKPAAIETSSVLVP